MMKVLVAPDSFKGSLTSFEVAEAVRAGIRQADATIDTKLFPLSDGGEGFVEVMHHHLGGVVREKEVNNPLLKTIKASYLQVDHTAYIEMAQAAGWLLLTKNQRDPLETSTYGVGELILDAFGKDLKKIVIGIGGSATNDAGMGMANALGYRFLDKNGAVLFPSGKNLHLVETIDDSHLLFDKNKLEVTVLCDVVNPLFGADGAAYRYAPQKGASAADVKILDTGLRHFSKILTRKFQRDFAAIPGAGAAGGMGAGLMAFLGGRLVAGTDEILRLTNFEDNLEDIDLVVTGEGKIDRQSLSGKLISGIIAKVQSKNIPVIAFCGQLELTPASLKRFGLHAAYPLQDKTAGGEANFLTAADDLRKLVSQVLSHRYPG